MMRSCPKQALFRHGQGVMALGLTLALASLPAVAAPPGDQPTIRGAVTQPLRDLNLMRTKVAPPLQTARAAPYDIANLKECETIRAQIAQLDGVLGPDVDEDQDQPGMVTTLAASAVRSAVKLPFSGVVRRLSGADARERQRQQSVQAGMARRAFLKGVALERCNPGGDVPYLTVAAATPAATPAVDLRPAVEPEPPTVQVAEVAPTPTREAEPIYAASRSESPRQIAREPVYVWVASDSRGPDEPSGR
jgi:hypothetical protein